MLFQDGKFSFKDSFLPQAIQDKSVFNWVKYSLIQFSVNKSLFDFEKRIFA